MSATGWLRGRDVSRDPLRGSRAVALVSKPSDARPNVSERVAA
jgi:hypothetical protein